MVHVMPGFKRGRRTFATLISLLRSLRTTRSLVEIYAQYPVAYVMVLQAAHGSSGEPYEENGRGLHHKNLGLLSPVHHIFHIFHIFSTKMSHQKKGTKFVSPTLRFKKGHQKTPPFC